MSFFKRHQSPVTGAAEPTPDDLAFLAEHAGEPDVGPPAEETSLPPSEFQVAAGIIDEEGNVPEPEAPTLPAEEEAPAEEPPVEEHHSTHRGGSRG
jgi:hypothetical protein